MVARSRRKERNLKKEQGAKTREQCLQVAIRLFAERGYQRTTMDDVAEAAGVTKGAVYWHFPSKDDLLLALLKQLKELRQQYERWSARETQLMRGPADRLLSKHFEETAVSNMSFPWV